ncbi:hypothetical protein AVEN_44370-1 [Araneus ventricosus]|uniref:Uncharacterized protein n=1 Tax=Araneus ventricosus TaxID=182803 RepID=A0A4Y2IWR4_ARAVE|nr:hypothetical protein AVEN_44370-1 [Araneus ventricosus]
MDEFIVLFIWGNVEFPLYRPTPSVMLHQWNIQEKGGKKSVTPISKITPTPKGTILNLPTGTILKPQGVKKIRLKVSYARVLAADETDSITDDIPEEYSTTKSHIQNQSIPVLASKILKEALAEVSTQKFRDPLEKLPSDIRDKNQLLNDLRRQWQRTRDPEYRRKFYKIKGEVVTETEQHLLQKRLQQIESLTPESRTLLRRTQLLHKPYTIPPLRRETGSPALSPIEKAEVIADSLRKQFGPNTDSIYDNPTYRGKLKKQWRILSTLHT